MTLPLRVDVCVGEVERVADLDGVALGVSDGVPVDVFVPVRVRVVDLTGVPVAAAVEAALLDTVLVGLDDPDTDALPVAEEVGVGPGVPVVAGDPDPLGVDVALTLGVPLPVADEVRDDGGERDGVRDAWLLRVGVSEGSAVVEPLDDVDGAAVTETDGLPVCDEVGVPVELELELELGVPVCDEDVVPVELELGVPVRLELGVPVCEEEGVPVRLELGVPLAVPELVDVLDAVGDGSANANACRNCALEGEVASCVHEEAATA